ncbi:MAG: hypothetical protein R3F56_05140 [Planctomycetota bacterium]
MRRLPAATCAGRGRAHTLALAAAAALVAACAGTQADPPDWIYNPPMEDGYLHGIGSYVGALHSEDNQGYAMEQARAMLSRSLRSRVVNLTNVRDSEASSDIHSETLVSSEYVLQNSELVNTWIDYGGQTGRPGTVWVLMRIPRDQR